jgi:2-succinyl-6-hydroxy-2,4-cyclohexadiene-1-carboxylate synthase
MKPLIFIHGFLGSRKDLNVTINGFKIHFFELPGHGENQKQLARYDLTSLAHELEAYLEGFQKPYVWGYSLGGRVLQKVIERGKSHISGAILESTAGFQREPLDRFERDKIWAHKLSSVPIEEFLNEWYSQELFKSLRSHPKYLEILELRKGINPQIAAKILVEASPVQNPLLTPDKIPIPTLVITGENDAKYSKIWASWIDKNPNLDIRNLEKCGHTPHIENLELTVRTVQEWLAQQEKM